LWTKRKQIEGTCDKFIQNEGRKFLLDHICQSLLMW